MRKITLMALVITLALVLKPSDSQAQVKNMINNSKEVLDDLNDTEGFPMDDSEKKGFMKLNTDLTNNLEVINKSDQSDQEKEKGIDKLFDDRDKGVKKLFNNDQTRYEKFQKKTSKKLNRTKRKAKINLAKTIL